MEKILFIVEPYPLRSSREFYRPYLNFIKFSNALGSICECSVLAPQSYLPKHYRDLKTKQGNLNFYAFEDFFEYSFFQPVKSSVWSFESVSHWKNYAIGGNLLLRNIIASILDSIDKQWSFTACIYWGCNRNIFDYCLARKVLPIAMELGCTRSPFLPTYYFDCLGVNGFSYSRLFDLRSSPDFIVGVDDISFLPADDDIIPFDLSLLPELSRVDFNLFTYLVPLQLCDDANIVIHSRFNTMYEYLNFLGEHLSSDVNLLVKPHPGALAPGARYINRSDHYKCKLLCQNVNNMYWIEDDSFSLPSIVSQIDAVLSINSSMAFEASLLGIPVHISGDCAFFSRLDQSQPDSGFGCVQLSASRKAAMLGHYLHPQHLFNDPSYILAALRANRAVLSFLLDFEIDFTDFISDFNAAIIPLEMSFFRL